MRKKTDKELRDAAELKASAYISRHKIDRNLFESIVDNILERKRVKRLKDREYKKKERLALSQGAPRDVAKEFASEFTKKLGYKTKTLRRIVGAESFKSRKSSGGVRKFSKDKFDMPLHDTVEFFLIQSWYYDGESFDLIDRPKVTRDVLDKIPKIGSRVFKSKSKKKDNALTGYEVCDPSVATHFYCLAMDENGKILGSSTLFDSQDGAQENLLDAVNGHNTPSGGALRNVDTLYTVVIPLRR